MNTTHDDFVLAYDRLRTPSNLILPRLLRPLVLRPTDASVLSRKFVAQSRALYQGTAFSRAEPPAKKTWPLGPEGKIENLIEFLNESLTHHTRTHLKNTPGGKMEFPQRLKPFTYARSNGTAEEAAEKVAIARRSGSAGPSGPR